MVPLVSIGSFHHPSPEPLTCAHSAVQNSHLHSHRRSRGGPLGGAGMTPGFDTGSGGRHPHSLGRSNLQVGSGSSEHLVKEHGKRQGPKPPIPYQLQAEPLVPELSPWPPAPSPTLSTPTWPTGAGKGLPEVFAVSMGRAGPRCTGVAHSTTRFHIHSVAGR